LSLRSRLTLFFVLAVVVPVLALTLTVTLDRPPAGDLDRRLPVLLALLTVAFCAVATLLGALLARLVSEPLRELVPAGPPAAAEHRPHRPPRRYAAASRSARIAAAGQQFQ
jgi:hypothetical protein